MEESKMNAGIMALLLVTCLFGGWEAILIVSILILLFGKIDDSVKKVMITVVAFFAGLTLFSMFWSLIVSGVKLGTGTIVDLVGVIDNYLDKPIDILKLNQYLLDPVSGLVGILDNVVKYMINFAKYAFIISFIVNKGMSDNFITRKINVYVDKFTNYVNNNTNSGVNNFNQNNSQNPINNANSFQMNYNVNPNDANQQFPNNNING